MNRDVQLNFCQTVLAYIRDGIHVDGSREDDCVYVHGIVWHSGGVRWEI